LCNEPHGHLSPEELAWLTEEPETAPGTTGPDFEREKAEAHARGCGVCGPRLRSQRAVQARLRSMAKPVAGERRPECPAEDKWAAVAAGIGSADEASLLIEHASSCDHCGYLLREASEDLNPEISANELEVIRQLPSATDGWPRDMGRRMAEVSATGAIEQPRETLPYVRWFFANWTRWAVPLAVTAVVVVGAALWTQRSSRSLALTNQLITQAYTEQRPIEFRFAGAGYGPVRQERGENDPSRSRMDLPPVLLEAEEQIARRLATHPQDPGWLQAKARTDLFEGHYASAIRVLQQAEAARPEDVSLRLDLATAYFERAGTRPDPQQQAADYNLALESLNKVLGKNSNDLVALFNRAIVYARLGKSAEATADLRRYLELDPSSNWSKEATRPINPSQFQNK
jgi:tetratricopeptide (TPR) repeat protein